MLLILSVKDNNNNNNNLNICILWTPILTLVTVYLIHLHVIK
jgi:hypothetical protein